MKYEYGKTLPPEEQTVEVRRERTPKLVSLRREQLTLHRVNGEWTTFKVSDAIHYATELAKLRQFPQSIYKVIETSFFNEQDKMIRTTVTEILIHTVVPNIKVNHA